MPLISINYLAVFVAGFLHMLVGALWYSPIMFGKIWMKGMGYSMDTMDKEKQKGMGKLYLMAFIGALVTSYVLAHFLYYMKIDSYLGAMQMAGWAWLGFIATTALSAVLWEQKPWKVYLINVGYSLVAVILTSLVLTAWPY